MIVTHGFRLVFTPIDGSREDPKPEYGDHLAVLVEYLKIVLQQQQVVLSPICDYFKREGLIEVSAKPLDTINSERVARLLLSPFSDNADMPTTSRFSAILQDWRNRKMVFSDKGQKDALRATRDAVFLASLPEENTLEMVAAISNAIQKEMPNKNSLGTAFSWDADIAEKIGRYAHALLMGQRTEKKAEQSFLFAMLNKNFEDTDTSILFDDRIYQYVFLNEPVGYRKKKSPQTRIDEFAKGFLDQLEKTNAPESYEAVLRSYLDVQFQRDQLFFFKVSRPQSDRDITALDEVMKMFPRLVFIQMKPDGNVTDYENIMMQMAQIDRSLTELFSK
jgi:hypothetical protein